MVQSKITLTDDLADFLAYHKEFGFKSKSDMIRDALERLKKDLERKRLEESAALYSELYDEDEEMQEWVEDSMKDFDVL
jgi:Arc/MetJ-type ribon-helix-helix transcriptional regulator